MESSEEDRSDGDSDLGESASMDSGEELPPSDASSEQQDDEGLPGICVDTFTLKICSWGFLGGAFG